MRIGLDDAEVHHLLVRVQDGVLARRQLLDLGGTDDDVERLLRRRDLTVVHPGVYVHHTGPLTRDQRAWAAVLACRPAALAFESALPHPPDRAPIQVAVDVGRRLRPPAGVEVYRMAGWADRLHRLAAPPRIRLEHATLDVASRLVASEDVLGAFRTIADVCHTRRTTPTELRAALDARTRIPGRRTIVGLLDDLATGACSVLEREYLHAVERAHGLPSGQRQAGGPRGTYRDVVLRAHRVVVELDGRAFHDNAAARDVDHQRDLDAAVLDDALTVRLTYGQVFGTPCRTAAGLADVLHRRGWTGVLVRCPRCSTARW